MTKCVECGKYAREVCDDGFCRACHKSISFESCMNDTWFEEHPMLSESTRSEMRNTKLCTDGVIPWSEGVKRLKVIHEEKEIAYLQTKRNNRIL